MPFVSLKLSARRGFKWGAATEDASNSEAYGVGRPRTGPRTAQTAAGARIRLKQGSGTAVPSFRLVDLLARNPPHLTPKLARGIDAPLTLTRTYPQYV